MVRILIALLILLVAAYFYLNQDSKPTDVVPTTPEQALEKAKQVEQTVQEQAKKLEEKIEKETSDDDSKKADDETDDDDGN